MIAVWWFNILRYFSPANAPIVAWVLAILPIAYLYSLIVTLVESHSFRFSLYSLVAAGALVIFSYASIYTYFGVNVLGCEPGSTSGASDHHLSPLEKLVPGKRDSAEHADDFMNSDAMAAVEDFVVGADKCAQTTRTVGLYFSVITWSTLGYGDIAPSDRIRMFVGAQALLGLLITGILVGILASAIIHRWRLAAPENRPSTTKA